MKSLANPTGMWRAVGAEFAFIWFLVGGLAHFVFTDALVSIVPSYVPFPRLTVWVTGVFEILGACGLFTTPELRRLSGLALIALTVAVTPANIEMLAHAERYPVLGPPLLWLRLGFQPVLIWIIWKSTRTWDGTNAWTPWL